VADLIAPSLPTPLLILEERLREQEAEGVQIPEGMERDELTLRVLIAAETGRVPQLRD
jgi:hypothetical protein